MLCPAAVGAAAVAVWLLAALSPGLSLPAEDHSEPGFSPCSHCFHRRTPPRGASAGPLLRPLCHRLPGGQAFATLSRTACDTAVYSAFHLSHGWTEREGEEGGEPVTEQEEGNIKAAVPALLRGRGGDPDHPVWPTDSLLQHWDSTVTTLVRSSLSPQCSTLGGDLYILTGAGGLGAAEDGEEACQTMPLWSALCCAVSEGKSGFSVGLIREAGTEGRQVSVKELEELLGLSELFSEGCAGADGETAGIRVVLHSEGLPGNIELLDADLSGEHTGAEDVDLITAGQATEEEEVGSSIFSQDSMEDIKEDREAQIAGEQDVTSESPESSADYETVDEQETHTNSSSMLVYVLSTALSILKAPLQPVFSTVTKLPEQVTYVLQEDLGVLSALPGETMSFLHLLTSDLLSWMGSAAEMLLGVGETCFFCTYYCTSSMLEALLSSCLTGVTGMGTLAGDTVGVFGDALDNAWWVTKFFGGRLWYQSEGYVGTVVSEMGGQAKAVGGGFGRLAWRSGNGVGNVFRLGAGFVMGMVDMVTGAMREAFGQESE